MSAGSRYGILSLAVLALLFGASGPARAGEPAGPPADSTAAFEDSGDLAEDAAAPVVRPAAAPKHARLEALVPALAEGAYRMSAGPRPYRSRLAFSPGFGSLGAERLFSFRLAFNPNDWLGYEGSLDHNPAQSVHAVLHSLSVLVRRPFRGRIQPYLAAGYGMFMVFPGRSLNADPVTKNALTAGGGLELFIRDDLALRGDMRRATVFGREKNRDGVVTYDYVEQSIGLVFYRSVTP